MSSIGKASARAIGVIAAAGLLTAALAGPTMARTGSSAGACQRNGWTVGQTSWGSSFNSKDACLTYVRAGGTVYKPSFVFNPSSVPVNTDAWMYVKGFHPNSTGTLTEHLLDGSNTTFSFLNVPTNAQGNMAVISTVFTSCANGPYSVAWSFTDQYGVHAGATVSLICGRS